MKHDPVGGAPRLACRTLPPERLLLPDVQILDPGAGVDQRADLLVAEGLIAAIGPDLPRDAGTQVLDHLRGCHVFPGFVDVHTHLRTPGLEYKEDLDTATRAAAAGGFVAVVGMANTDPVIDGGPAAQWLFSQATEEARVRVGQVGAVSRGLAGQELAELRDLLDSGVAAFSDDGRPVESTDLLLHALRYLRGTGRSILLHLEDRSLSAEAVMHEGRWSARLGLRGLPSTAESGPLAVAVEALRYTVAEAERLGFSPTPLHVQHVSAAAALPLLVSARKEGLPLTAEVSPHHLLLTDERVRTFDPNLRINPPLRSEEDRVALVQALADGTIACVATDHAPHAPQEKEVPFEEAASGTVGLESAFATLYAGLVAPGRLPLERLVEALSSAPAACLGLPAPRLQEGAPADLCVVDLEEEWVFGEQDLRGKSRNSAFLGQPARGRVLLTVVDGARRHERERAPGRDSEVAHV
jgi:dihydroorotase